jgi:hypothetical protein
MDPNVVLEKIAPGTGIVAMGGHSFAEYIGAMIWPATISRPDIAYAVARVGSHTGNPSLRYSVI